MSHSHSHHHHHKHHPAALLPYLSIIIYYIISITLSAMHLVKQGHFLTIYLTVTESLPRRDTFS